MRWSLLVVIAVCLVGCDAGGYRVVVRFEPVTLADSVTRVEVSLVADCDAQPPAGGAPVGELRSVAITRMGASGELGSVPAGSYGLYARGRDADCDVVAAGCAPVELVDGGEGDLVVTAVPVAGPSCAAGEACAAGACVPGGIDAGDVDAGEADAGDADTGAEDAGRMDAGSMPCGSDCGDLDDDCNTGECDSTTGECVRVPVSDGTSCSDGDRCTTGDTCRSGVCTAGSAIDCSSRDDDCNAGVCDPASGCRAEPVADGTSCSDGDGCTTNDTCNSGTCTGTAAGIADFRLNEVYGGSPDYIEIVNPTGCALDVLGLRLLYRLACESSPSTFVFPSRTVPPGGVLRVIQDGAGLLAEELSAGMDICHRQQEEGWAALCTGTCGSTCTAMTDYVELQGGGVMPMTTPPCATFAPAPLDQTSARVIDSATRVAFTGSGSAGQQSDWALRTFTRP